MQPLLLFGFVRGVVEMELLAMARRKPTQIWSIFVKDQKKTGYNQNICSKCMVTDINTSYYVSNNAHKFRSCARLKMTINFVHLMCVGYPVHNKSLH